MHCRPRAGPLHELDTLTARLGGVGAWGALCQELAPVAGVGYLEGSSQADRGRGGEGQVSRAAVRASPSAGNRKTELVSPPRVGVRPGAVRITGQRMDAGPPVRGFLPQQTGAAVLMERGSPRRSTGPVGRCTGATAGPGQGGGRPEAHGVPSVCTELLGDLGHHTVSLSSSAKWKGPPRCPPRAEVNTGAVRVGNTS